MIEMNGKRYEYNGLSDDKKASPGPSRGRKPPPAPPEEGSILHHLFDELRMFTTKLITGYS